MTAPSITTPHVRSRGVSMTQSKSYSHGRICSGLLHSSTSLSPPLPPFCLFFPTPLCSCWCLSFILSVPLSYFHLHFPHLTIEMSSLSSMEQGITSQVVWFNPTVHSSCPNNGRLLKKKSIYICICGPGFDFQLHTLFLVSVVLSSSSSFHLSNRLTEVPFHRSNYN